MQITNSNSLLKLLMRTNQIDSFPTQFVSSAIITHLDLSGNQISSIPSQISEYTSLESLYLSFNAIQSVNENFAFLPNLVFADLSYNQINSNSSLSSLDNKKLKKLFLSGNRISFVPDNFLSNSINLRTLDLSDNYFKNIENLQQFCNFQGTFFPQFPKQQFDWLHSSMAVLSR